MALNHIPEVVPVGYHIGPTIAPVKFRSFSVSVHMRSKTPAQLNLAMWKLPHQFMVQSSLLAMALLIQVDVLCTPGPGTQPIRITATCSKEGCTRQAQVGGVCVTHGAKRTLCKIEGCANGVIHGGVCMIAHAGKRRPLG
eukprot:scaffold33074_cov126-Skeletonema_dohrnii-CCMP3373.AAC.5